MSRRPSPATGLALIVAASVAFGFSGPLAKGLIGTGMPPTQVTWLRVTGAGLALTAVALPVFLRRPKLPLAGLAAFGLAAVAGVQAFYFLAVQRLPVGIALLFEFAGPVLVVAWIRFVRRSPLPRAAVLGTAVSLAGICVVVQIWTGLKLDGLGLLFGACAAVCQAAYFVGGERLTATVDTRVLLSSGFLVGAVALTPIARPWDIDWSLLAGPAAVAGARPAAWILAAVLIAGTVIAYLLGIAGLKRLSAPVAGALGYLEVVVAFVAAWALLGERPTPVQLAGGAIVIAGVFLAQRAIATREPVPSAM